MADSGSSEVRAFYRMLRAAGPVHFDEQLQHYAVVRYHDVKNVLTDTASFSSDWGALAPGSVLDRLFEGNMNAQDPPRHTHLRGLISRAFTPRSIADLEPAIARTANMVLDAFVERGAIELDADFSAVVPTIVIAELLGLPASEHAYFRDVSRQLILNFESVVSGGPTDTSAQAKLDDYLRGALEQRRARPREDLMTRLLEAEIEGERLSERELLSFCKLLLVAGNTTVTHLVTSAVLSLLEHPAELARLRSDPTLLPSTIEEVLRYRPPNNVWHRMTTKDVDVGGTTILGKRRVVVVLGSANHDEAVFPDPDRFDVTRSPNPHLAFSGGPHFCLGASLARLEGQVLLRVILERLVDVELAKDEPVAYFQGMAANGALRLPLRFRRSAGRR